MTIKQIEIEQNIKNLISSIVKDTFIFDLLLAYGEPKATIARLKNGDLNHLSLKGELTHRKKLFFKIVDDDIYKTMDKVKINIDSLKQKPRFIILTDFKFFLAYDTKIDDTLDIKINELTKHFTFLLPLNKNFDVDKIIDENPADVRASSKLAKLYDEILKENPTQTHEEVHALNVFLTRLLFCYFAEDSNIFEDNIFTNSIAAYTSDDGSDLNPYLDRLFDIFNTTDKDRKIDLPEFLKAFPYVNGGLFRDKHPLPHFTTKSRNILIEIGTLNWSAINPDIFGSMIQAVVTPEHRGDMGMHYTSVPNIMKVIKPLFLDELYEEFEKAQKSKKRLYQLHTRVTNLKIFDPACGSGNFLIIAYKELRILEMKIYEAINTLNKTPQFLYPEIKLTQFYGIELDDFAHEVAILSLWLTEHQMNLEFFKTFGRTSPSLPLKDGGHIVYGNATRLDWEVVCPKVDGNEIYVLGNPPYLGYNKQSLLQKEDMRIVFCDFKNYKKLDYISCWFYKGNKYIKNHKAEIAFVSTNSITQGEQVALLWPIILDNGIEISFAYTSFKWNNSAKSNAAVTVVVIGLRSKSSYPKYLYYEQNIVKVNNINPYLTIGNDILIKKRTKPLSALPIMMKGSQPTDGGNLILTREKKDKLLLENSNFDVIIKRYYGAKEYISGDEKYCLWIEEENLKIVYASNILSNRLKLVTKMRLESTKKATNKLAEIPYRFGETRYFKKDFIIIPTITSERREYIPCGFLNKDNVASNTVQIIYDYEPYIFGIVSSKMQTAWVKAVGGKFKTDYIFSSSICYNTFPFPNITDKQKEEITELVFNIIEVREEHSEKTLAQLYDPDKMPLELKEAHHQLDLAIEKCYRNRPFKNNEERLEYLFRLYEEMIKKESMTK